MANGALNLIGGLASGFVGGKNQAKQTAMMEEYRKTQTEMIKLEAKKAETALKMQELEAPIMQAIAAEVERSGGGGQPLAPMPQQVAPAGGGPFAGFRPPQAQSLPMELAQGQFAINIPGNPAGNISVRQNNPGNLKYVGQEGAAPGTRGFAIFSNPQAGFNALMKQVDIDKGRGLTLAQFGNKYAPPFENDTASWINNVAKMTGVTPDTPISNISTPLLAQAVSKVESGTTFGGPQPMVQPQQAPGTIPMQSPRPMGGGITGQKLLEGWLKKKFGVEPDEVKYEKMGGHLWVMDKKGAVLGVYPGQGDYKMTEIKRPDGSVVTTPMLTPPAPLPPGVPVFSMPGGGGGMGPPAAMFGQGVQTSPPEYTYQDVKTATGATRKEAVPKAQPGISFETEPPGIKIGDVGKIQQIINAESRLNEVMDLVLPNGELNRGLLFKAAIPGGGIGEGSQLQSKMYQVIDAALRLETGAQATPGEIEVKMKEFWPSSKDTEAVIRGKLKDLVEYISRLRKLNDPTGEVGKMGGVKIQIPQRGMNKKPKTWEELKNGLVGGQ